MWGFQSFAGSVGMLEGLLALDFGYGREGVDIPVVFEGDMVVVVFHGAVEGLPLPGDRDALDVVVAPEFVLQGGPGFLAGFPCGEAEVCVEVYRGEEDEEGEESVEHVSGFSLLFRRGALYVFREDFGEALPGFLGADPGVVEVD